MNPHSIEVDFLRFVIRRQVGRPCAFSRRDTGVDEFARVSWRIRRLDRWGLLLVVAEIDRLLADGYLCEVCRWKVCLFTTVWFAEKLPLVAWRFRSQVPGRSQLQAAGRDLEAEIEAAIRPYRRLG